MDYLISFDIDFAQLFEIAIEKEVIFIFVFLANNPFYDAISRLAVGDLEEYYSR